ncbi:MAG: NCS2 family permease [Candidatus Auribacterota bacterium]|nr:NCS2 family permease [Candidatus Auribacterota bacterium]
MINRFFKIRENNSTITREAVGGITTFMTMCYILFVQPAVLAACGMDSASVFVATCISSAIATLTMGFLANYPIALAPAMGHNFYFAFVAVPLIAAKLGEGSPHSAWAVGLGAVCISGILFIALSFFGIRETIVNAIPSSLKNAIAVGIGLLIALVGFEWSGIIESNPGTLLALTSFKSASSYTYLSVFGLIVMAVLAVMGVRGSILIGIICTMTAGIATGLIPYHGLVTADIPSIAPTFFKLDIIGAIKVGIPVIIFVFFFLDLFDTIGTLIGVSEQAGFIREDGTLPRASKALLSDAIGTVTGAVCGTSTVTSYIESAAGISSGARTGLANIVTGILMLLALFFSPLVEMIGIGIHRADSITLYPVIAPALIMVGFMMMRNIVRIEWDKPAEALASFFTLIIMPFGFGITEGISFGFISYAVFKTAVRQWRDVHPVLYIFALLFILRYIIAG